MSSLPVNQLPSGFQADSPQKLYHQTLAIRPKLIKLIEKYSQKKDDFTQLNEKFIKARRDYEALLESSMSHPPGPAYHHHYAHRPSMPSQAYPPAGPGYAPQQGPPPQAQQDPQRYYTPGPQGTSRSAICCPPPPNVMLIFCRAAAVPGLFAGS